MFRLSYKQVMTDYSYTNDWIGEPTTREKKNNYYFKQIINDSYHCIATGKVCYLFTLEQVKVLKEKVRQSKKIKYNFRVRKEDGVFTIMHYKRRKVRVIIFDKGNV